MFYDVIPHQTMSELCLYMDLIYHMCDGLYVMHKGLPVMQRVCLSVIHHDYNHDGCVTLMS